MLLHTGIAGTLLAAAGCSCWCIEVWGLVVEGIAVVELPRGTLAENEQRLVLAGWIAWVEVVQGKLAGSSLCLCSVHV